MADRDLERLRRLAARGDDVAKRRLKDELEARGTYLVGVPADWAADCGPVPWSSDIGSLDTCRTTFKDVIVFVDLVRGESEVYLRVEAHARTGPGPDDWDESTGYADEYVYADDVRDGFSFTFKHQYNSPLFGKRAVLRFIA